jgi:hypothetical protein
VARKMALHDVAAQVLRTIGAEYSLHSSSTITGSDRSVEYNISGHLSYSANGFIDGIDRNIISESHDRTPLGIVYRMRVRFSRKDIERFRKLSLGADATATHLGNGIVEVSESNGVPVTLTRYPIKVDEKNSNADFLSYYVMKVSSGESKKYSKAFRKPVHIKDGSHKKVKIKVPH